MALPDSDAAIDGESSAAQVGTARALISTADKRQNRGASRRKAPKEPVACLVKGCEAFTPPHLRLCKRCYHECVAGKHSTLVLKTGEKASYDSSTQRIVFPDGDKGPRSPGKPAVTFAPPTSARPIVKAGVARPANSRVSLSLPTPTPLCITIHVDSGAGQSLCSCPDAFLDLRPCAIEVVGVSGSLPVFGVGTANNRLLRFMAATLGLGNPNPNLNGAILVLVIFKVSFFLGL